MFNITINKSKGTKYQSTEAIDRAKAQKSVVLYYRARSKDSLMFEREALDLTNKGISKRPFANPSKPSSWGLV